MRICRASTLARCQHTHHHNGRDLDCPHVPRSSTSSCRSTAARRRRSVWRRIYLKLPPEAAIISPQDWCSRLSALLLAPFSPGSQLAVMGLVNAVLERGTEGYEDLQAIIVRDLAATTSGQSMRKDYLYYGIPSPWLQCKCALTNSFSFSGTCELCLLQRSRCGCCLQRFNADLHTS